MHTTKRIVAGLTALALAAGSSLVVAQPRGHDRDRGDDRGHDRGHEPRGHAYGHDRDPREGRADRAWHRGDRLPVEYRNRQYVVDDWRGHRLSAPPRGYHWVQADGNFVTRPPSRFAVACRDRHRRDRLGAAREPLSRARRAGCRSARASRSRHHRRPADRSDLLTFPTMPRALCAVLALAALAGCELMKKNEEVTAVINRRAVGMPAGEFFDRYGDHGRKRESGDGSAEYDWLSSVPFAKSGPEGLDERICRLRISVDPKGRISAVQILFDAVGLKSTSRCAEIFQ